MSKHFAAIQHAGAEREKRAANPAGPREAREKATRDDERSGFSIFGDPLWGMAIISAALFAVLAALIAAG